jgi:hypothetical protein
LTRTIGEMTAPKDRDQNEEGGRRVEARGRRERGETDRDGREGSDRSDGSWARVVEPIART